MPSRTTRAARCPAFFVWCSLFLSVSNLSCRLSFLLSLDNLLDLNLHLMFFVLRLPSLQSTCLVQRSVTVCCPSVVSVSHPFSTRHLSIPQLQFSLQSRLGVLLPSRQPSLLVMLPCVDDFQCPCFSSSACCWLCSARLLLAVLWPAVGYALLSLCSAE